VASQKQFAPEISQEVTSFNVMHTLILDLEFVLQEDTHSMKENKRVQAHKCCFPFFSQANTLTVGLKDVFEQKIKQP
jgi:hypothetical protein